MHKLRTSNNLVLQKVDCWPYEKKVIAYAGEKPLPSFGRMLRCPKFPADDVHTDGQGNIIDMPSLFGRPCFGIPTAYLRERYRPDQLDPKSGKMRPAAKCLRCKVRKACLKVVTERVRVICMQDSKFVTAMKKWDEAEGFKPGGFPTALGKLGKIGWINVCAGTQRVSFASNNDAAIRSYWQARSDKFFKSTARANAAQLRSDWKVGNYLHLLVSGLDQGHQERVTLLHRTLSSASPPKYLRRFPMTSAERLAYAWWGREYAKLTGQKTNPNRIARILIKNGRNLNICESSLRSSLASDLDRIDKLESAAQYNGGAPIWPRFLHPLLLTGP